MIRKSILTMIWKSILTVVLLAGLATIAAAEDVALALPAPSEAKLLLKPTCGADAALTVMKALAGPVGQFLVEQPTWPDTVSESTKSKQVRACTKAAGLVLPKWCYWHCTLDSQECYDSDCDCDPSGRCHRDFCRWDLICILY